uniref:DUF4099 domain-containing protein n=1 Tax=Muribaculum intestinale TaxID=1796646 RepID=UPI0025B63456
MENIQEQEVLIARNNETGQVGAVVGQNPDGTPKMLKPYEVEVKPVAQTQEQTPAQEQTTTEVQQEPEAEPKPEQESVQASQEVTTTAAKATPVDPNRIDWATIEQQWGVKRETLEQSGALQ